MNNSPAQQIARAVLYEGYILYPYRASALKNRQRWAMGGLAPRDSGEPWMLRAECLVVGDEDAELSAHVRFLHPVSRLAGQSRVWQEAVEREVAVPPARLGELAAARREAFAFPAERGSVEWIQHALEGAVEVQAQCVGARAFRVTVRVLNLTCCESAAREERELRTLASAHVALRVRGGEFVSLTDPPEEFRQLAAECRNEGVWPVLVGEPRRRDEMLGSPIILPDYPRVAPESDGDFFDGTEIDELLALRVLTLTESEKREMCEADPRARELLERVESLPEEQLRRLHGANRSTRANTPRPGDRVRLHPRGRADAFDVLLAGKCATVLSVEVDFEGTSYFAVTIDDDPGAELGAAGQIGHRFFFRHEEVELLSGGEA